MHEHMCVFLLCTQSGCDEAFCCVAEQNDLFQFSGFFLLFFCKNIFHNGTFSTSSTSFRLIIIKKKKLPSRDRMCLDVFDPVVGKEAY